MSESCNSRHFSWLMKSCFPNPNDNSTTVVSSLAPKSSSSFNPDHASAATTIISLPDDILLDCLSRVPTHSIPHLSLVCRRWSRLLLSPIFSDLRRLHGLLRPTLFALSASDSALFAATLRIEIDPSDTSDDNENEWRVSAFLPDDVVSAVGDHGFPSHARLSAVGPRIYMIGRNATLRYDTWTRTVTARSPMKFSRKKFAAAAVSGKIYVAGGGPRTTAVEEYDPEEDKWRVVANASRSRYGCIGASVDGVFYVIGGLKLGASGNTDLSRAASAEAHVYASSMDLYDVEASAWLRSRAVPGGGCVVAACAAAGFVYVLASHAVELSFWRFDARRKIGSGSGGVFGEWCRIRSPPLPAQVRVDSTVRFSCAGVGDKVVLVQVSGCIDDLLRRSGRSVRGLKEGLVMVYDTVAGEWSRAADLPELIRRAACVCVEC
ncbi:BTB-kelch protein [Parasponia andersonii]|uniref:BTB-kelch protein n=1 Tax=Parasponia andersonii TaxID=3476 RepID=A0A2P5DLI1_PARAD|nr:BTB-kelch protein [Parasponia andersonii]